MKVFLVSFASRVPLRSKKVKMKEQAGGKIFRKRSAGFMFATSTLQRDLLQNKVNQTCFASFSWRRSPNQQRENLYLRLENISSSESLPQICAHQPQPVL